MVILVPDDDVLNAGKEKYVICEECIVAPADTIVLTRICATPTIVVDMSREYFFAQKGNVLNPKSQDYFKTLQMYNSEEFLVTLEELQKFLNSAEKTTFAAVRKALLDEQAMASSYGISENDDTEEDE